MVYDVTRPERRKKRSIRPGKAYFVVPHKRYHVCHYAKQDDDEHNTKVIVVRSFSEITIDICIIPQIDFDTDQIYIGCEGGRSDKPSAIEVDNRFIVAGHRKKTHPGIDPFNDYIDKYGYYHYVEPQQWPVGEVRALGFKFKTSHPGRYKTKIFFVGNAVAGSIDDLRKR